MKTAISIPDDLFRSAERASARLGLSRSELYRRALALFLDRNDDRAVTEALDRVYGEAEGRLDPHLQQMQAASLAREPW
jgi:metal-responsive CopG/Arc/MetJ family transcriptional regulator